MARNLTDKQKAFLEALFSEECMGDFRAAMRKAGYSDSVSLNEMAKSLADEIMERAQAVMSQSAAKAAFAMAGVLDNPTEMGVKEKMAAAEKILDRVGIVKVDKVNVTSDQSSGFVFVLPAKKVPDAEEE